MKVLFYIVYNPPMVKIRFNPQPLIDARGEVSRSRIARRIGISVQLLRLYEQGTAPGAENLFRIVRALNLPLESLFIVEPVATMDEMESAEVAPAQAVATMAIAP